MSKMRQRADWMNPVDDEILEYLQDQGGGTPKVIADNIGKNNTYITDRCSTLVDFGLLNKPGRGFYQITDEGEAYLAGELDASDLEPEE